MKIVPQKYVSLDWSKRDCELSDELGVSQYRIYYWRKRLKKPRPALWHKRRDGKKNNQIAANYGHLDFENKRDVDLATECGISRERIRQARAYLGKPKSRFHKMGSVGMRVVQANAHP